MHKLPPELHIVNGTKGMNQGGLLPEKVRGRIPVAEWLENPAAWDRKKFIEETSEFLFTVYGIGSDQDRHTLAMLADNLDTYIRCATQLAAEDLVSEYNDGATKGPNPLLSIRNNTLKLVVQLMNELGLTPRSRLAVTKPEENTAIARFLQGPKGAKA